MTIRLISSILPLALLVGGCGETSVRAEHVEAGSAGAPRSAARASLDACKLVTQAEAATLFGETAGRETGAPVTDPAMLTECIWGHDSGQGSHQLQVRVWGSPTYFFPPKDEFTRPLEVGERGYVRVHPASGVDIAWVQDGKVIELSYFTVGGAGMPKATDRVDAVTALAKQTSARL